MEILEEVSLNDWGLISQIVSGSATFLALLFAAYEYYLHKKNNQYEAYSKLNERYCNDRSIQKVMVTMIESYDNNTFGIDSFNDNCGINQVNDYDKEMFLRFFEELNYAIKKKSIRKEEACYYFGYYAVVAYLMGEDFVSELENEGIWESLRNLQMI